jgi:hypothetical protein
MVQPPSSKPRRSQVVAALRVHYGLALIVAVYISLATAYSVLTPIWEAPDEVSHFMHIRYLAQSGKLPSLEIMRRPLHYEAYQPPLYYVVGAIIARGMQLNLDDPNPQINPGLGWYKNQFLHTAAEKFPYHGLTLTIHLLRLLSIVAGAGTVVLTYVISLKVFPQDRMLAALAAGLNALIPQWTFITGVINNDGWAALFTTWSIFWAMCVFKDPAWQVLVALGVSLGLSILTKLGALPACVLIIAAMLIQKRTAKRFWQIALVSTVVMGVSGWYLVRNQLLYSDPFGLKVIPIIIQDLYHPRDISNPQTWSWLLEGLPFIYRSFWAAFGQANISVRNPLYSIGGIITVVGTIGAGFLLGSRQLSRQQKGVLLFFLGAILVTFVGMEQFNLQFPTAQGRMMFPIISAMSVLLAAGLCRVARAVLPSTLSWLFLLYVPVFLLVLNINCLANNLVPAYQHIY